MKVAFTSTTGEKIDEHFGTARTFYIWDVSPEEAKFLTETAAPTGGDEEDRISARADVIADCAIVCTMQIGGPAAAKLVARKIHPMKTAPEASVAEVLGKLQEVLSGTPPPWLRKAMNRGNAPSHMSEGREEGWLTSRD